MGERVTLHAELIAILSERDGGWMSTDELASEVDRRGRYRKRDGSPMTAGQVHLRTREGGSYDHLFERDSDRARLRADGGAHQSSSATRTRPAGPPLTEPRSSADAYVGVAMAALAGPGDWWVHLVARPPEGPGLYAIHADQGAWRALGLGDPPDARPLYVGKAEASLGERDLSQHFADGNTGSSTLRRSIAALLHDSMHLSGRPRNPLNPGYFSSYGLSSEDDQKLTTWMKANLRLATWRAAERISLGTIEHELLLRLRPPLNLRGVLTDWSSFVREKRTVMADEARAWAATQRPTLPQG